MKTTLVPISSSLRSPVPRVLRSIAKLCMQVVFLIVTGYSTLHAQPAGYDIQANIIYRFTKYVDWPEDKKTGDFIIGVVGDSPLTDALKNFIVNKTAGKNQKIVIKKFASVGLIGPCHILFISEEESGDMKKIVLKTNGDPVLIVTEADGLAQKGACINFVIAGDHLRLEINKNNIEQRDLNIASELLQLGKVVQ